MSVELTVKAGSEIGKRAVFTTHVVTVGSSAEADMVLKDPLIDARHLAIERVGSGRTDLLLELARLRVLRGVARWQTGSTQQGAEDLTGGINSLRSLLGTGGANAVDCLVQSLSFQVMLYLGLPFDPNQAADAERASMEKARTAADDRQCCQLLAAVRSSLLHLQDVTSRSGRFPDYVKPKLKQLGQILAMLEPRRSSEPSLRSIIKSILRHR